MLIQLIKLVQFIHDQYFVLNVYFRADMQLRVSFYQMSIAACFQNLIFIFLLFHDS